MITSLPRHENQFGFHYFPAEKAGKFSHPKKFKKLLNQTGVFTLEELHARLRFRGSKLYFLVNGNMEFAEAKTLKVGGKKFIDELQVLFEEYFDGAHLQHL